VRGGRQQNGSSEEIEAVQLLESEVHHGVFADPEEMKHRMRAHLADDAYDVTGLYWDTGFCQRIARHPVYESATLWIIVLNSLWISIDVDLNTEASLFDAHLAFIVAENFFCLYFFIEWALRFGAFRKKTEGFQDAWFLFDTCMAWVMVVDTWILSAVLALSSGTLTVGSTFKVLRLVRLVRMARVLRILNAFPELKVVVKGMNVAARATSSTIVLMLLIIYVFAVFLRQVADGTALEKEFFSSVPVTMRFLLITGILPDLLGPFDQIWDEGAFYAIVYLFFALLVSIMMINMLVGVLVGVVNTVADVERESMMVEFVRSTILNILKALNVDEDHNGCIDKNEFLQLMPHPSALRAFHQMGVDVVGLCDHGDYLFSEHEELQFGEFMELVMELRGSNNATVKDIVELRKFFLTELRRTQEEIEDILDGVHGIDKVVQSRAQAKALASRSKLLSEILPEAAGGDIDAGGGAPMKLVRSKKSDATGRSEAEASQASEASAAKKRFASKRKSAGTKSSSVLGAFGERLSSC